MNVSLFGFNFKLLIKASHFSFIAEYRFRKFVVGLMNFAHSMFECLNYNPTIHKLQLHKGVVV